MLMRIDTHNFITHMIDYFTREELVSFNYIIISNKVINEGRLPSIYKLLDLYPTYDGSLKSLAEYNNYDAFKKLYLKELKEMNVVTYQTIVEDIMDINANVVIVSHKSENMFIDIFVEYLKKEFGLKCIDLNILFTEGKSDIFYIDKSAVEPKIKEFKKLVKINKKISQESSTDGRLNAMRTMSKKEKMKKLKELDIKVNKTNINNIDELLIENWVYNLK